MTAQEIKKEIHRLIDDSPEDKLEYVYSILQTTEYSDGFKSILDDEYDDYQENKEGHTREDLTTMMNDVMNRK